MTLVDETMPSVRRIHVVGTTGAGKSTLAGQLAAAAGYPHVELDALHWEENWTPAPVERFQARVRTALAGDCWVVDGNYRKVRPLVWERVEVVVWLDYPLPLHMWRLLKRGLQRSVTGEELWGTGNRESLRNVFFSGDSLFVFAWRTHARRRAEYRQLLSDSSFSHIRFVHLTSPGATEQWRRRWIAAHRA